MNTTPPTPRPGQTAAPARQAVASPAPLSHDQLAEIELGRRQARTIRRTATVASISGWSLALFALATLASGVFGNWPDLAVGIALAAVAFNELKGADQLRAFEPHVPKRLALGQLVLGVVIVAYAAWNWYAQIHNSSRSSSGSAEVDALVSDYVEAFTPIVWGGVAIVGVVTCWLTAAYYASKARTVRVFRERTPPWVIEVLAKAG